MRYRILLTALICWAAVVSLNAQEDWITLENCRLIPNPANDGDSFHVSAGETEYNLRLYLVDAPETDAAEPARLIDQAKYFEVSVPQTIEVAEAAKEFVREKLTEPFTVLTRMTQAGGRSKIGRIYAFVETKEGDLGEQLVRNGLARIYGAKITPPGLSKSRTELDKLQQLEDAAKQEKIGAWGINEKRLDQRAEKLRAPFSVFALAHQTEPRPTATSTTASPTATPVAATDKIDVNTATAEKLESLPRIGP